MEYLHIRIDYYDSHIKANQTLFDFDFTEYDVITEIMTPYMNGQTFFFKGVRLEKNEVRSVRIFSSQYSISYCVSFANEHDSSGFIPFSSEDLLPYDGLIAEITTSFTNRIKKRLDIPSAQNSKPLSEDLSDKVFIVHGHDRVARLEVEAFVKQLGLKPVVLFQEASEGHTIIEKLEKNSDVAFAIVLYTHCDDGKSKESDTFSPRARQNVVFEHGYFVGKLGRRKVFALVQDKVEKPGDYDGVVYIKMDSEGAWKISLTIEIKKLVPSIDLNNVFC